MSVGCNLKLICAIVQRFHAPSVDHGFDRVADNKPLAPAAVKLQLWAKICKRDEGFKKKKNEKNTS